MCNRIRNCPDSSRHPSSDVMGQYLRAVRQAIDAIEATQLPGIRQAAEPVRRDDPGRPAGPRLRHGPLADGRRGDVPALRLVPGLPSDRRAVDELSQPGGRRQRPAPGDVPGERPGVRPGPLAELRRDPRRRASGHLQQRLQCGDDRRGARGQVAGDVRRGPDLAGQRRGSTSRHESGKKLHEVADLVLDQQAPPGDSAVWVPGWRRPSRLSRASQAARSST